MERFINILIVDDNVENQKELKSILMGGGNNVLLVNSFEEAHLVLDVKEIGILLVNIDGRGEEAPEFLKSVKQINTSRNVYKIVITKDSSRGAKYVRGMHDGAVDFILEPFNPNLIQAKIDVFKSLYHKDQRINQLLRSIFPSNVLEDLNTNNKYSPRRVENGVVLFTDFEDFSFKAKNIKPIRLVKKLEYYFNHFDTIVKRYHLEKIKTIGDAFMVLGGVTENTLHPAIRACLAALEMRDFVRNEKEVAKAVGRESWEIRIGIHMGPLVAGIIGSNKMSFDVWGDTVNIASRSESGTIPGTIAITKMVADEVGPFFNLESRGEIPIQKRGGKIEMFLIDSIRLEYCLYGEGKYPSTALRAYCGLSTVDFEHMKKDILNRIKALIPEEYVYHDIHHIMNVEKAAVRFARLEGIDDDSILLLQTAVLYHDAGFILQYENNENFSADLARANLPKFGYSQDQIDTIANIILSTGYNEEPVTILERIMCDADHDYLGRADYHNVAKKLRKELENVGFKMSNIEWIDFQLSYLEGKHRYYTITAKNIRLIGKKARISELKEQRIKIVDDN
jgi:class 3 adenylate cyclase/predicted metal-dependent HD superfamily phosphohydrolase